jgi:protein-tyrosine phosphatase
VKHSECGALIQRMSKPAGGRVCFVCYGNICRSPTAEGVFLHLLKRDAPNLVVQADSAGTSDYHLGSAPDPRSQQAAMRRGIDLSALRARQIALDDFQSFDFILAMDRENLAALKSRRPKNASAQVQLFLEFAPQMGELDVPDPYYGDAAGFERVLDLTTAASTGFLKFLQNRTQ